MHRTVVYSAKGSFIGPTFVIKNILMAVIVGIKNPVWLPFSGIGTLSCTSVKPFFSTVWSEL